MTRINQIGSSSVITPVILAGMYNYSGGSFEGEVIPLRVDANGKLLMNTDSGSYDFLTVGSASFSNITSSLILLDDTTWDDLRVPMTATKLGAVKDPQFEVFMNSGSSTGVFAYAFDKNAEEELFFAVQIPHNYKMGTNLHPHVHWGIDTVPIGGTTVRWGLEYTIANIDDTFGETETIYTVAEDPATQYKHILSEFPAISGSSIDSVSTMLLCRIFRDVANDDFAEDAFLFEFDFHYEIDSFGSRAEYIK